MMHPGPENHILIIQITVRHHVERHAGNGLTCGFHLLGQYLLLLSIAIHGLRCTSHLIAQFLLRRTNRTDPSELEIQTCTDLLPVLILTTIVLGHGVKDERCLHGWFWRRRDDPERVDPGRETRVR